MNLGVTSRVASSVGWGEPMKSQFECGEPPKVGMKFLDSMGGGKSGEPLFSKKLVEKSDTGGCCD